MSFIRTANLADITITKTTEERTFEHPSVHPAVAQTYKEKGYDTHPKNAEEANARGLRDHNGLAVTVQTFRATRGTNGTDLFIELAPTRYLVRQAMADYIAEHGVTDHDEIGLLSPKIIGPSVIAIARINDQYHLISQVKGKALGSGQFHFGYVAGGIRAKDLEAENPLVAALKHQIKDESGIERDALNLTNFKYIIDERETGHISIGAVARGFDFKQALTAFERDTKAKIAAQKPLEVNGFAPVPLEGLAIVPVEKGEAGIANVRCYLATAEGLEERIENRGVRPYSEAWVAHLADKRNLHRLLEYAGF